LLLYDVYSKTRKFELMTGPEISAKADTTLGCIELVLLNTAIICNKNVIKAACISFSSIVPPLFIWMAFP
ncbi:MAG: hypothetical protein ACLBM6_08415, partial [Cuspidothrix sp.]